MSHLKNARSKEFWQRVRNEAVYENFRVELELFLEEHGNEEIPVLKYSDFKLFFTTGNRTVYQKKYFLKRRMLSSYTLLSLIYPEKECYIDKLSDLLFSICDEYTWSLPAHQPRLEENNSVHIDLFASETGFYLAEICDLVGDRLDILIKERVRFEVERRIVVPFENSDGNRYFWEKTTNNWASVCAGSIGCTLMLLFPEKFYELKYKIDECIEHYLNGFKDDGICDEGVNYWHYGFGFFLCYADMLIDFTDGKYNYFERPKVNAVAQFLQNAYLSGDALVSFSDSARRGKYHLGTLSYLKSIYPDDIALPDINCTYNYDNCYRYALYVRSVTWLNPEHLTNEQGTGNYTKLYDKTEWFIHKCDAFGFACKGGNNNESHNHNDVGSFIIAKNGKQILSDLGVGVYTRQYFAGATRYDHLNCSSRGHSLPIINGEYQCCGKEYKARSVEYKNGVFSLDIAEAYSVKDLKKLNRSFSFGEDQITLTDSFELTDESEITERLVSIYEPRIIEAGKIKIEGVILTFNPDICELTVSKDYMPGHNSPVDDTEVYLTDFKLKSSVREFKVEFAL